MMQQLRPIELNLVDELFETSPGYVLDFTNSTYAQFFRREVGVDIYDDAYAIFGGSKGKRLRAFLSVGQPRAIARALTALWEYREIERLGRAQAETVVNAGKRLSAIVERLGGMPLSPFESTIEVGSEQELFPLTRLDRTERQSFRSGFRTAPFNVKQDATHANPVPN
ncbi:hypothetical protein ACETIH_10205 [Microvirga arabica]|uniref:DUF3644 domain-containing protein n=1 Tax=Microvirga arabica TaxID=1128671 RepID=A0ABV6Y744_9HYPH